MISTIPIICDKQNQRSCHLEVYLEPNNRKHRDLMYMVAIVPHFTFSFSFIITVVALGHTYVLYLKIRFQAIGITIRANGIINRVNGIRSLGNGKNNPCKRNKI